MLIIAGTVQIRPETRERAIEAGLAMQEATRAEPGCIQYGFSVPIEDESTVLVFEVWEDQAANDAHSASAHMADFLGVMAEVVDGPVELTKYEVSSFSPL